MQNTLKCLGIVIILPFALKAINTYVCGKFYSKYLKF
jgi:hypothetical protein